jgi:hypothetical protein
MKPDAAEAMRREVDEIRAEIVALKNRTGELDTRLRRLEAREELLESPSAAGDRPVKYA